MLTLFFVILLLVLVVLLQVGATSRQNSPYSSLWYLVITLSGLGSLLLLVLLMTSTRTEPFHQLRLIFPILLLLTCPCIFIGCLILRPSNLLSESTSKGNQTPFNALIIGTDQQPLTGVTVEYSHREQTTNEFTFTEILATGQEGQEMDSVSFFVLPDLITQITLSLKGYRESTIAITPSKTDSDLFEITQKWKSMASDPSENKPENLKQVSVIHADKMVSACFYLLKEDEMVSDIPIKC